MVNNAIAWAHFQLRGGLSSLWFCGFYVVAVVGFYALARSIDPIGIGLPSGWVNVLMGIQTLSLVLFGASRVSAAIRGDITSRMIESHRLMPTSPAMAMAGYLAGGAAQPLMIGATTFVIGAIISATAGLAVDRWILSNGILALFAVFIWCLVSLGSFISTAKGPMGMGWVIGLFMITVFSQGMITVVLPALTILISPIMGGTVFVGAGGAAAPSLSYAASLVGQIVIGSLYFVAASRRYRSAELTGFTPLMALALLIAWVALTIFGIKNWGDIQPGFFRRGMFDRGLILAQVALSIGATMLLSLLPLAVSSRATRDWRQRRALHDPGLEHRPTHPVIAVLVCAAAGWAIALCLPAELIEPLGTDFILRRIGLSDRMAVLVSIGAMLLAYSLSMSYVFRIAHRLRWRRGAIAAGFFLIAFWMSPIIAEVVRNVMNDHNRFVWTRVVGASPVGTLILVFAEGGADPIPGVLVQFLVALLLATIFYLIARRERVVIEPPSTPSTPSTPEPLPA